MLSDLLDALADLSANNLLIVLLLLGIGMCSCLFLFSTLPQ